jgi:5,5'-dehydrodivanillate O-demethylase
MTWRLSMKDDLEFWNTKPGTPAGRYMRLFWHPVFVAERLPAGRAVPIRIMNEDFTLYRGESGTAYIVDFRCAHRATQLSAGWVEGNCIRCRYHGWKYDNTGQCVEQPGEAPAFAGKARIRSYPTEEYLGLIFAYLGHGEPPSLPRLPESETKDAVVWSYGHARPCNFLNGLENDPTHLAFTHRGSEMFFGHVPEVHVKISAEETEWGLMYRTVYPSSVHISHHGMPNITYSRLRERERFSWKVPLDDDNYLDFQANLMNLPEGEDAEVYRKRHAARRGHKGPSYQQVSEAVLRGELTIEEIEDRSNMNWIQDYVTQVGQGHPRDYLRNERLGPSDVGVILARRIWEREVRALLEGRPLKKWLGWEHLEKGSRGYI